MSVSVSLLSAILLSAVTVDFSKDAGTVRRLNGNNGGPCVIGRGDLVKRSVADYRELSIPNARFHDIPLVCPGLKICDVQHIFPIYNPKADPKDAANYYFEPTDDYIRQVKACGVESITFRLGASIEWTHPRTYFAKRPKDIGQFAEVCAGIVRHYRTGWADGFDAGKVYWEIWCEPNSNAFGELWDKGKGLETYYPLYVAVARRIKSEFPEALVGGPASNACDFRFADRLSDVCRDEGAALDFFSWHQYISTPEPFNDRIAALREMLDRKGFTKTELHLNEWHWMPACWSDLGSVEGLRRWSDTPDGINGIESAAMVVKTLVTWQESKLDMANYYLSCSQGTWGLYDKEGQRRPTYYALAWFGRLAKDFPRRAAATADEDGVSAIAGSGADGSSIVLVSDFRPQSDGPITVRLSGNPPCGHVALTSLRADAKPVLESVACKDGILTIDRRHSSGVYLIELPARRIVSPDGRLAASLALKEGEPHAVFDCDGERIAEADLGLVLDEPYAGGFELEDFRLDGTDTVWRTVWGDRAVVKERFASYVATLREKGPKKRILEIELRAYPEGWALRYLLPGTGRVRIRDERTHFTFEKGTVAWPIYNTEDTYPAEPRDAANLLPKKGTQYLDHCMLPLTVRTPSGVCASLFEAYVRSYPRAKGEAVRGGVKIRLIGDHEGRTRGEATVDLPFATPWRALQVGANAARLVENSTLVLNLNPPCAIGDVSWIGPGLCLSDLGNCPLKTDEILAAAARERENGIRFFQLDWGWCGAEWTWTDAERAQYAAERPEADREVPEWRANTVCTPRKPAKGYVPYRPTWKRFRFGTTVDLDIPRLVKGLEGMGMGLALYMHGRPLEQENLDELFALYRAWGVSGLKPGFVRYGDAASTDWIRRLVEIAARHRIWLDIHDRHVPDGMERTYPNLMLCEGGGGEEGNHPVRQDVSLPFARCLVGPFDYTPKLFREDRTHAHSAAMLLVYPGPAAILRGPARDRGWGPELDFVKRLPMTYDETKVLAADIGRHLIVARRRGDVWYVAGICGEDGFRGGFMLDFLGRGNMRTAHLCTDGEDDRAVSSEKRVMGGGWFPVSMEKSGGFVMILEK